MFFLKQNYVNSCFLFEYDMVKNIKANKISYNSSRSLLLK